MWSWLTHMFMYAAKLLQSCLTPCDPMDCSLPGFSVHGILQTRTLEWVAISFSNAGKWKVRVKSLSRVWLLATPWTAANQAPPSMGFSRQEHWSGLPFPSPCLCIGKEKKRLRQKVKNLTVVDSGWCDYVFLFWSLRVTIFSKIFYKEIFCFIYFRFYV